MRLVIVFAGLQMALTAIVLYQLNQPGSSLPQPLNSEISALTTSESNSSQLEQPIEITASLESELRSIVRSEMLRTLQDFQSMEVARADKRDAEPNLSDTYSVVNDEVLLRVENEFSQHLANGFISSADMVSLQYNIAQLDEKNRQAMLTALVKALNSGDLEGSL